MFLISISNNICNLFSLLIINIIILYDGLTIRKCISYEVIRFSDEVFIIFIFILHTIIFNNFFSYRLCDINICLKRSFLTNLIHAINNMFTSWNFINVVIYNVRDPPSCGSCISFENKLCNDFEAIEFSSKSL